MNVASLLGWASTDRPPLIYLRGRVMVIRATMRNRFLMASAVALACVGLWLMATGIYGTMRPARPECLDVGMLRSDRGNDSQEATGSVSPVHVKSSSR